MVRHQDSEAQQVIANEDRPEHENIRQMHAALVRVVEDHHVAGREVVAVAFHHGVHGIRDRTQVQRQTQPLRDQAASPIAKRTGHVHRVFHDGRVRDSHDRQHHLVHDRPNGVLDQLKSNSVNHHVRPSPL